MLIIWVNKIIFWEIKWLGIVCEWGIYNFRNLDYYVIVVIISGFEI